MHSGMLPIILMTSNRSQTTAYDRSPAVNPRRPYSSWSASGIELPANRPVALLAARLEYRASYGVCWRLRIEHQGHFLFVLQSFNNPLRFTL